MSTRTINPNNQNASILSEMIVCTYTSLALPKGVVQMIIPEDTSEPVGFNKRGQLLKSSKSQNPLTAENRGELAESRRVKTLIF